MVMNVSGTQDKIMFDKPMVFVDIETNGLNHIRGRIIEVAAIRVENGKITRVFNQLIDPESEIPYFITNLTGIRQEDLRGAAPFRNQAAELHDILSGAIFVAHNVRFDYSFLKQEFKRVGKTFLPKQLCTVNYPGHYTPTRRATNSRVSLPAMASASRTGTARMTTPMSYGSSCSTSAPSFQPISYSLPSPGNSSSRPYQKASQLTS